MKLDKKDISISLIGTVLYKGVDTGILSSHIHDFQIQTGFEFPEDYILKAYNSDISVIRDNKLKKLGI